MTDRNDKVVWNDELQEALVEAMNAPYNRSFDDLLEKARRDNERMLEDERGDMWFDV